MTEQPDLPYIEEQWQTPEGHAFLRLTRMAACWSDGRPRYYAYPPEVREAAQVLWDALRRQWNARDADPAPDHGTPDWEPWIRRQARKAAIAAEQRGRDEAAKRIAELEARVKAQARELANKDRTLHEKNIALDGMGWVWCDGGCKTGTGRFTDIEITEEMVAMVERNTRRLRTTLTNRAALSGAPDAT